MDDLDDVRAFLGYDRINLYGGSYGTRAALVYLRQHGEHVRSIVLDGVAPTDMRLPLFTARDAQHALDNALVDCDAEPACRRAFPEMATRIRRLIASLEQHPRRVRIVHPRTGIGEEVTVDARLVASVIFSALYSPLTASIVPALVDRAEQNDFQGLFALALASEDAGENMSIGMQLSVLCSEDASQVSTTSSHMRPRPRCSARTSLAVSSRRARSGQRERSTPITTGRWSRMCRSWCSRARLTRSRHQAGATPSSNISLAACTSWCRRLVTVSSRRPAAMAS